MTTGAVTGGAGALGADRLVGRRVDVRVLPVIFRFRPAAGMQVSLYQTRGEQVTLVKQFTLNADGRNPDGPLYDNASLRAGTYRLEIGRAHV